MSAESLRTRLDAPPMPIAEREQRENEIDGIRNTILEAFDDTNDMNGPNWEVMAQRVFDGHVARALEVCEAAKRFRSGCAQEGMKLFEALEVFEA